MSKAEVRAIPTSRRPIEHFEYERNPIPYGPGASAYTIKTLPSPMLLNRYKRQGEITVSDEQMLRAEYDYHKIINRSYLDFMNELENQTKFLYVTSPVWTRIPNEFHGTTRFLWTVEVASPQLDYFAEFFKCRETHYDPAIHDCKRSHDCTKAHEPDTLKGALKLAWRRFIAKFKRIS